MLFRSKDVEERAERESFVVYDIEIEDKGASFCGALRKLAQQTGGRVLRVQMREDVNGVKGMAQAFSNELHGQYLLGFTPASLDGMVHKIEVRTSRKGLTVFARKSYVAAKRPAGS